MTLADILDSFTNGFIKRALTGAGLTLGTSGSILVTFNQMLDTFQNSLDYVSADILALAHIAGIDYFMSLLFGAYVTKFVLGGGTIFLKRL